MATFTKRIDANIRDVGDDGSPLESSATSLGNPGAVTRAISLRFTSVTIPQGASITSAKITFVSPSYAQSITLKAKIEGVDEDNTAEFVISPESTAKTRTKTTANVAWEQALSVAADTAFDTPNIGTIVQEIVDRAGWSSGNAMAFYLSDNGSSSGQYIDMEEYNSSSSEAALLTIVYVGSSASLSPSLSISLSPSLSPSPSEGSSPSASQSPSSSISPTPSFSVSLSPSISASASPSASQSPSASNSPSPSPVDAFFGLKIAKPGFNVLLTDTPHELVFSSDYGTLKYFTKQTIDLTMTGDISVKGTYTHNLGYYPYTEVYVRVYTGSTPSGTYQYCPFDGAGATVLYSATYRITESVIDVYGMIEGASEATWHFDFIIFVFKNDLLLS